jgi:thiol-disulfide isomerase/thioredoxin
MLGFSRRLLSGRYSVLRVTSEQQYEQLKSTADAPVLVGWFSSRHSLACKLFEKQFDELAAKFPNYQFFKADVDDAPRAAYDCEVTDVPQISVLPIGKKPDGSFFDKADWQTVKAELGRYDQVVSRASEVIGAVRTGEEIRSHKKEWAFDPATGTSQ